MNCPARLIGPASAVAFVLGTPPVVVARARQHDVDDCSQDAARVPHALHVVDDRLGLVAARDRLRVALSSGEEMRRRPDEIDPWREHGEGGGKLRSR